MTDNNDEISQLLSKLETLLQRQDNFSKEINALREEINMLKTSPVKEQFQEKITGQPVTDISSKKETVTPILQTQQEKQLKNN